MIKKYYRKPKVTEEAKLTKQPVFYWKSYFKKQQTAQYLNKEMRKTTFEVKLHESMPHAEIKGQNRMIIYAKAYFALLKDNDMSKVL